MTPPSSTLQWLLVADVRFVAHGAADEYLRPLPNCNAQRAVPELDYGQYVDLWMIITEMKKVSIS